MSPHSTKFFLSGKEVSNPLFVKEAELFNGEGINFWEDNWTQSLCYFSGGLLGLT